MRAGSPDGMEIFTAETQRSQWDAEPGFVKVWVLGQGYLVLKIPTANEREFTRMMVSGYQSIFIVP